jgi:rod shape-determining protein MreD
LTLPFAALGALIAALVETSVLPELQVLGTKADLVLVLAIVATILMGVEDGLVWAFLGGLMLDMLTPARPLGATTLALLIVVGLAIIGTRVLGPGRIRAVVAAFALTWLFHLLLLAVLMLTEGITIRTFEPRIVLAAAVMNAVIAVPAALAFGALGRRFGAAERADW